MLWTLKEKVMKSNEKLELKLDMHVWWMFDRFWIEVQGISASLWGEISIRKSLGRNFEIILSLFWDHGGTLEGCRGTWCWKIALKTKGTWWRTSILSWKVGLRPSCELQSVPKGLPNQIKVVKRNNQQWIDKLYAFEGGFLVSLDAKMTIFSNKIWRSNYQL